MKTIYVIDADGFFISEMYATQEEMASLTFVEVPPPSEGAPKWNGEKWVVTIEEEKEEISVPSIYERVNAIEMVIMELMMEGK
ncbi:hypothetical protein [Bacillus mobilis]|uniref:hypothetical protein n=1 Tax=Bacillus mobilis TaxID=2026190 RepID=UPI003CF8D621